MSTSKYLDSPSFPHQRKFRTKGLQDRCALRMLERILGEGLFIYAAVESIISGTGEREREEETIIWLSFFITLYSN